jgi:hypothetical protein
MNQRLWLEVCKSCSTFWSIASLGAFRPQGWARPPTRAGIAGCARFSDMANQRPLGNVSSTSPRSHSPVRSSGSTARV